MACGGSAESGGKSPAINRERPPVAKSIPQLSEACETGWRRGELPLPTPSRAVLSHFPFFEISSEDTHFNPFQLRHLQALANHHLETEMEH